jgi:hypothetical protein
MLSAFAAFALINSLKICSYNPSLLVAAPVV